MSFRNKKIIDLLLLFASLVFIGVSILLDMVLVNLLLIMFPLLHFRYLLDSYELDEDNLIVMRYCRKRKIPLSSLNHVRRIYGFAEENIEDKSATYLIADGKNYRILNKCAKNIDGLSILDLLINEKNIPIKNEKAIFFIKTRIKE